MSLFRRGAFIAGSDCEADSGRWLAQPANSLSSLGYLLAGAAVARSGRSALGRVFAATLAANAPGGIAFHGPGGRRGKQLHDGALLATIGAGATLLLTRRPAVSDLAPLALMGLAAGVHALTRTGCRACRPQSMLQGHAAWHLLSAGALGWWGAGVAARESR